MLRKIIIFLLCLLPVGLSAQLATGTWRTYMSFGNPGKLLETPDLVYCLTQGSLYSYDKEHDENRAYMPGDDLNGSYVSDIFYNADSRYLLVCYSDANVDLLYDDGRLVNLPDIRDAKLNISKSINDVKFDGDLIYVATNFGLVVFRESTADVKESGIYDTDIRVVVLTDSHVLILASGGELDRHLLALPKGSRLHSIHNYVTLGVMPDEYRKIVPIDDKPDADGVSHFIAVDKNPFMAHMTVGSGETPSYSLEWFGGGGNVFQGKDKTYAVKDGKICSVTLPARAEELAGVPEILSGKMMHFYSDPTKVWVADADGFGQYKLEEGGGVTVLRDKFAPTDVTTFSDISLIFPSSDGRGFYISNLGMNMYRPIGLGDFYETRFTGNFVSKDGIENIELTGPMSFAGCPGASSANKYGANNIFSPSFVIEDPDDHSIRYIGSSIDGVFVVKDGQEIGKFDANSSIYKIGNWAWRTCNGRFDDEGNLIVAVHTSNPDIPQLAVLPAAKRRGKNLRDITKDDWVSLNIGYISGRDIDMLLCKRSPMIFMVDSHWNGGFAALHHGGTVADPSDDRTAVVNPMVDQDGKTFSPSVCKCLVEDKRGRIWCGTTSGIFEISNPLAVFSSDFNINRLKVPRNDGTNLADYLLESENVNCIAVDAANRKWVGTMESGVYLVSENGDEVLANFNTDNSPLSTNTITAIYADPNSNSVFVATLNGLYEYSSDTSPARQDYSDVYAYPNPVEPGYSGWITIKGLMDSSLVKIMDSGMHLVYQTTSQGGMALWDGCSLSGARVKSGVYYVLASTGDDTSSEGDVVAKILVVN